MAKSGDRLLGAWRLTIQAVATSLRRAILSYLAAGGVEDEDLLKMTWFRMTVKGLDVIPGAPLSYVPFRVEITPRLPHSTRRFGWILSTVTGRCWVTVAVQVPRQFA
jgi:hypothetical protein